MEKMDKGKRSMMHHYVSHGLAVARALLNDGRSREADNQRSRLITNLEKLEKDPSLDECLGILRGIDWTTKEKVNIFHEKYRKEIYSK